MKENDPENGFMYKNENEEEKANKYYCFDASSISESSFISALDCLIQQAKADEQDKPCYDDCQNRVCE
jgi:hypothetical protein